MTGTVYLASRKNVLGLGRIIAIASGLFGVGLIFFSFSRNFLLSLLLMILTGFGLFVQMTSANTVLQTLVEEDKRGRVMSFHAMAIMGMTPFGSLLAGSLASQIGALYTVMISGISCILGSLMFAKKLPMLRLLARPIYVEKGIIEGIPIRTEEDDLP